MEVKNELCTNKYTTVFCEDELKYNAPHHFTVKNSITGEELAKIDFQEGPVKEVGINGVHNEDLILMVISRLESFQRSEYRCNENSQAIEALEQALSILRIRTNARIDKCIEGTSVI